MSAVAPSISAIKCWGSGYDSIRLTIIGEHKGETVREVGQIYVRAKRPKAPAEEQVSLR